MKSVPQAATESGVSAYRIRKMIEEGTLRADRTTNRPMIPDDEYERVLGKGRAPELPEETLAQIRAVVSAEVRATLVEFFGRLSRAE